MTMRPYIAVIGKSDRGPHDPVPRHALEATREVGSGITRRGRVPEGGGLSGVMEATAQGAKQQGGLTESGSSHMMAHIWTPLPEVAFVSRGSRGMPPQRHW